MSKNKEKQQKPMPPFNNKPDTTRYKPTPQQRVEPTRSQRTAKSLEDFAKEVFEQLNEKNNQPQDIFTVPETKEVVVEPKVSHSNVNNPESTVTKSVPRNRPTFDENRSSKKYDKPLDNDVIKQNEIGSYVPSTKQALIQAIVASEIIGPPKAKQR
ncbi:hypothetical protein [Ureibacillus acetophenoni]|nr:hypothetical protein [Ureibacillus acetophenoni]